jgi:hypothetical protein
VLLLPNVDAVKERNRQARGGILTTLGTYGLQGPVTMSFGLSSKQRARGTTGAAFFSCLCHALLWRTVF